MIGVTSSSSFEAQPLRFLWLELTQTCNLECVHCYADSGPLVGERRGLGYDKYSEVIRTGARLGCRQIQFIGGEPTLNPDLPRLIRDARQCGYEFVEVFTNATRISTELLSCFSEHRVAIATSFYSDDSSVHDEITQGLGSHAATVQSIKTLVAAGIEIRAAIIVMPTNVNCVDSTRDFLRALGVTRVSIDHQRGVGRGLAVCPEANDEDLVKELCGNCWRGSVCVSAAGDVFPCIMARRFKIGSILEQSLDDLHGSSLLHNVRALIHDRAWKEGPNEASLACNPGCTPDLKECSPDCAPSCSPCGPDLSPPGSCLPKAPYAPTTVRAWQGSR